MATTRRHSLPPGITVQILVGLGVIALVTEGLKNASGGSVAITGLIVTAALALLAWLWIRRVLIRINAPRSLLKKVAEASDQQINSLIRRRAQLVRDDAYGKPQFERWAKEIDHFIDNHIAPRLTEGEKSALVRDRGAAIRMIADRVETAARDMPAFQEFSAKMTPIDFEIFCAEQLKRSGWDARITTASRDQGVDVVAERDRVRVVLQCKLYGRPVGNKAVQEATAARRHEKADYGIVVTNNGYTSAAEELARTNGILLLHYSDLTNLDMLLPNSKGSQSRSLSN